MARTRIRTQDQVTGTQLELDGVVTANGLTLRSGTKLTLNDATNTNSVSLKAPSSVPTSVVWELPTSGSAGQVLTTDGSGVLSFANPSGGGGGGSGTLTNAGGIPPQLAVWSGGTTLTGLTEFSIDTVNKFIGVGAATPTSTLDVRGSYAGNVVTKTTSYVATASDQIILANASTNGLSITFPAAVSIPGRVYTVDKIDSSTNRVSIVPNGSDIIANGAIFQLHAKGQSQSFISDGASNWHAVGSITYTPAFVGYSSQPSSVALWNIQIPNGAYTVAVTVPTPVALRAIRVGLDTATGNIDVGVYNASGNRLASSGSRAISADGLTSIQLTSTPTLNPGTYYFAVASDNTTTLFHSASTFGNTGNPSLWGGSFSNAFPLPTTLGGFPGSENQQPPLLMGIVNGGILL